MIDNYQEDRNEKIVNRTSSTNIGLELLAVISAHDLGFINFKKTIEYLSKILTIVSGLSKWNGHLYNWYNTKTLKPLFPRYISTVDSGNFVGGILDGLKNSRNVSSGCQYRIHSTVVVYYNNRIVETADRYSETKTL